MPKVVTKEDFISISNKQHGNKYDYSRVVYINTKHKVEIVCPEHGSFYQLASSHMKGQGCPECGKIARAVNQRDSKEDFIKKAIQVHGNKYDYTQVDYLNSQTKVVIVCPEHGAFTMKANHHVNGQGCPKCGRLSAKENIAIGYSEFIERVEKVHGNKYEYDESSYKNLTTRMRIFCSEHGFFEQKPHTHLSMKAGCPKCGYIIGSMKNLKGWAVVLDLFRVAHGDRYEYDEHSYTDVTHKMRIKCSKHGWFEQLPNSHYAGSGCNKCAVEEVHEKQKIDYSEFVRRAIDKHGNRYIYSDKDYIDIFHPVVISCKKHGEFHQLPRDHYRGAGCPKCISSRGENMIRKILQDLNISMVEQKTFTDLKHKNKLKCDFYLPEQNIVIEYNGLQHYEPVEAFGGVKALIKTQERDLAKYQYLEEKSISLIIVRYDEENIKEFLINKLEYYK